MSNTVRCPDCGGAGQELSATGSSNDCPNCDGKGLISNIPDDVMARVLLAEESDHTPAAFSPPTTDGEDNLTQPKGSGEQPTSVERDRALNAAKEKYLRAEQDYEVQRFKYINDLVAEERRQAKIEEAKFQYKMWLYSKDKATTLVVAEDHIANLELRGENNE